MRRHITLERFLIAWSLAWLAALALRPALQESEYAFATTAALSAVNATAALWTLTRRRAVLVTLNCAQVVLFGVLSSQLYSTFGEDHYLLDREPGFFDWAEFTVAHVLRAADLLHGLDAYGVPLRGITHHSTAAGCILVAMHVVVDVFLIGLVLRWTARLWRCRPPATMLERGRQDCAWLLMTLGVYLAFMAAYRPAAADWLWWPLDNLLRLVDIGDMFQVFHWRLHGVEADAGTATAAVLFRLAAGIWMTRVVLLLRVMVFRTWGLSVEQLTALLADGNTQERRGAAQGLSWSGAGARGVVPALIAALRDCDPQVRREAARALGDIGPAAARAVDALAAALWRGPYELRLEAARALGRIGPRAKPALPDIKQLLKVCDGEMRSALAQTLGAIAPGFPCEVWLDTGPRTTAFVLGPQDPGAGAA